MIEHSDDVLTEYEPVTPAVSVGERVPRGRPIGRVHGTHLTCGPGRCLHWAARRGGTYFDPLTLLARLGPVRLLPWTGLRAGVRSGVGLAQPLDRDMRIDLGRREARVAE